MELSPDLTPSFQLYISLQIGSKDTSFPVPVAFSSLHYDRCMCVWGEGRERERERGGREGRERESVCVCVDGFIVECPRSPPPPLYTLHKGLMIRLGALWILIYITLHSLPHVSNHYQITALMFTTSVPHVPNHSFSVHNLCTSWIKSPI